MTQEQVFQECQKQIDELPEDYKLRLHELKIFVNDIKSHFISEDSVLPHDNTPMQEDEVKYLIISKESLTVEAKIILLKVYYSAYLFLQVEKLTIQLNEV